MPNVEAIKHVCIHGHFYQPPRENPWLDEVEREPSATPYHDWNERINTECYRSNMAARIVDSDNRILDMRNNYEHLSFNFGPTLLQWLERRAPGVYEAILAADRESCRRFDGHGNAFAQVYNHIIMPLASRRDKVTQVRWGIRDFEKRFGRRPEGMWLAETAVDGETLEVLAEEGIKFTVLSPFQAARWRFIDPEGPWQEAKGGRIPTGRAYRYKCRGSKHIDIFFYDQSLAHGIAFDRVLEHSSKLLARIDDVYSRRPVENNEPWLANCATDGESYGHHFKFGDMALAAALRDLLKTPGTRIINYAFFLASFPVQAEVEIIEKSAWSCSHGVGRWQKDCGCCIGMDSTWNQKWRRPLRAALNYLRDFLAIHYEKEMGRLSPDPWQARNEYVDVLLEPKWGKSGFVKRCTSRELTRAERFRFFQLLEMQRCAMAMFTSCGWFFDEISELEAVLILRYAARAIQLAEKTGADSPEPAFLKILEEAPSNVPEYKNGANVYLKRAKPEVVEKDRVAANYALLSFVEPSQPSPKFYSFYVSPQQQEDLGHNPVPCRYGRVLVRDERTLEEGEYLYALLHFGGLDFRCSVKPYEDSGAYEHILKALQQAIEEQNTVKIIRILDEEFGPSFFSLQEAFRDQRSSIAIEVTREPRKVYNDFQRHMYQDYRPLMGSLKRWGIQLPEDMRVVVRRVLSDEVSHVVKAIMEHERNRSFMESDGEDGDFFDRAHIGRLRSVLEEAQSWRVTLSVADPAEAIGKEMVAAMASLTRDFTQSEAYRLLRLVEISGILKIKPHMWELQTAFHKLVRKGVKDPQLALQLLHNDGLFINQMDDFLDCRFARWFSELPCIFC
jgi:alpha-amylase/alpha-mannosidase (GH57 family)